MGSGRTRILKVDGHDEAAETEFELDFLRSLTTEERFDMVLKRSREMLEMLIRNGHRRSFEIVKRK